MSTNKLKVLQKDRKTFQRFCKFAKVEDVDLVFDSAAAKEAPVDFDELVANATAISESAKTRSTLEDFASLVFEGEALGPNLDINHLRGRWINRQESIVDQDVDLAVHEKIRQQGLVIEELESQLKNNSQISVQHTNQDSQTSEVFNTTRAAYSQTDPIQPVIIKEPSLELEKQLAHFEATVRQRDSELRELRNEKATIESKLLAAEKERNKFSFVEHLAQRQAERDAEVTYLKAEIEELRTSRPPSPVAAPMIATDGRDELKRNIFVKFAAYAISNEYDKMKSLIPVATELFHLRRSDVEELSRACTTDTTWLSSYLRI